MYYLDLVTSPMLTTALKTKVSVLFGYKSINDFFHFSVENSFQFLFQPLSLSTNVPPAVSNVRIHRLRRLPTKPSLHLRQRCCRILQEPCRPVQPEEMRIVTVSHDTFHNVDGCRGEKFHTLPSLFPALCLLRSTFMHACNFQGFSFTAFLRRSVNNQQTVFD